MVVSFFASFQQSKVQSQGASKAAMPIAGGEIVDGEFNRVLVAMEEDKLIVYWQQDKGEPEKVSELEVAELKVSRVKKMILDAVMVLRPEVPRGTPYRWSCRRGAASKRYALRSGDSHLVWSHAASS